VRVIPKSFTIMGNDITVKRVAHLTSDANAYGNWDESSLEIQIQSEKEGVSQDNLLRAFWHEAMHSVDDTLSLGLKHKDIDRIGQAIHQILKTKR